MTIPISLLKSIKAKCTNPVEYRLAVRSETVRTSQGVTIREGDFSWSESLLVFDKKYPVITTTVLGSGDDVNGPYTTSQTVSRVNGTVVGSNFTYDSPGLKFGIPLKVTSKSEFYLISCRCRDGEEVDCQDSPEGYCCIAYSLIEDACRKLKG